MSRFPIPIRHPPNNSSFIVAHHHHPISNNTQEISHLDHKAGGRRPLTVLIHQPFFFCSRTGCCNANRSQSGGVKRKSTARILLFLPPRIIQETSHKHSLHARARTPILTATGGHCRSPLATRRRRRRRRSGRFSDQLVKFLTQACGSAALAAGVASTVGDGGTGVPSSSRGRSGMPLR